MNIEFDSTSTSSANSSTLTYSHTCTGLNRILFVGTLGATTDLVTGITYNGIEMTLIGKVQTPSDRWQYLYYLINPATGANNIVISSSGADALVSCSTSYTGAEQFGQPDASTTNTASSATSITGTITTLVDNCWTVAWLHNDQGVFTSGAGTTIRNHDNSRAIADSNGPITPAGSTSLSGTWSGANGGSIIIASFAPYTGPIANPVLSVSEGKTLSAFNSLTFAGTDGTVLTFQGTDTYVGKTTTDTLVNKRITPRVVSVTNSTSITPTGDSADENIQINTQSTGTLTVNAPSGTPTDGQRLIIRIKSTNIQTFSWNSIYRGSTDITLPSTSSGSGKTDYVVFLYNIADTKWDLVSKTFGF